MKIKGGRVYKNYPGDVQELFRRSTRVIRKKYKSYLKEVQELLKRYTEVKWKMYNFRSNHPKRI